MISVKLNTHKTVYNKRNSTDFSNFVQNFNVHDSSAENDEVLLKSNNST